MIAPIIVVALPVMIVTGIVCATARLFLAPLVTTAALGAVEFSWSYRWSALLLITATLYSYTI